MKTEAVIFDKDGTLMDFDAYWLEIYVHAAAEILKSFNAVKIPVSKLLCELGAKDGVTAIDSALCIGSYMDISRIIHSVLEKYGYTFPLDKVADCVLSSYKDCIGKGIVRSACGNIGGFLRKLREKGIKLAVVTTDDYKNTVRHLNLLGISELFDRIYTAGGNYPLKPDPFCINDFCKVENVSKSGVIMVGDTLTDADFAENGNVRFIGVSKSERNAEILRTKAQTVVTDISHISDFIICE